MGQNFTEDDLQKMGLKKNPDGSYQPITFKDGKFTTNDPKLANGLLDILKLKPLEVITNKLSGGPNMHLVPYPPFFEPKEPQFRSLKLTLFGEPMAKQSVRQGRNREGNVVFFQPEAMKKRVKDYQEQIRKQLPPGFIPFQTAVFVRKMHFMYAPLKSFHKEKGKMEAIRTGKKFYKNTRPDLPDNLKKLVNDSMSELVFTDDALIVGEDNVRKYYGVGGCIIIELEGY